jgi:hypothetical protein
MVIQDHTETPILDTRSKVPLPFDYSGLSFSQKIKLRLNGMIYIGDHREEGWKTSLPYYAFRCKKHGLQLGYRSGYAQLLLCPECIQATVK